MVSPALPGVCVRRFYGPAGREPLKGTTRRAGVRDSEAELGGADMSRKRQRRVITKEAKESNGGLDGTAAGTASGP